MKLKQKLKQKPHTMKPHPKLPQRPQLHLSKPQHQQQSTRLQKKLPTAETLNSAEL